VSTDFAEFAKSVIDKLQNEVGASQLKEDPVYIEILQLLEDVRSQNFPDKKIRVSFSALNQQEDGIYNDDQLVKDIIHLEEMYKVIRKSVKS
tara:strand:- start:203457 stop:203732 length:276 start_codon:yes stop_codon:yes gene_type:complete